MSKLNIIRIGLELIAVIVIIVLAARHPATQLQWKHDVVSRVSTDEKVVALTFDDGPDPRFTPKILDILDKYHAKATFFMIGEEMNKHPEIVKEVVRRGHAIGNHTYTHPHDIELDTSAQIIRELEMCEQTIERLTGKRAYLFRPPRGLLDGTVISIAEDEGYKTILWTVCADHHDATTPQMMADRVFKHNGPGAIILAHDGTFNSRWMDVAATPLILEGLTKHGYRFVTVPELLKLDRRGDRLYQKFHL